jgi:hypothetical protein
MSSFEKKSLTIVAEMTLPMVESSNSTIICTWYWLVWFKMEVIQGHSESCPPPRTCDSEPISKFFINDDGYEDHRVECDVKKLDYLVSTIEHPHFMQTNHSTTLLADVRKT